MPRTISLDWSQDCEDRLQMLIEHRMKKLHKNQTYMGDVVDMSRQTFSYNLHHMNFKWIELVKIFNELGITPSEVGDLSERRH